MLCGQSGIPKVTGPDLGLYCEGRRECTLFGDRVTILHALSPVPFRGKEKMTVQ